MAHDASAASAAAQDAAVSFQDAPAADPMAAALDAVLGEGSEGTTETPPAAEGAPAAAAAVEAKADKDPAEPAANELDAVRLRKGYTKLAEERQKVLDLQNEARTELAQAKQWKEDAEAFKAFQDNPGEFVLSKLSAEQVNKLLETIASRADRTPAERRLDEIESRQARERDEATQQAQVRKVEEWKAGITKSVTDAGDRFDLVNSLGLHGDVIDVITKYHEKNSRRDEKGNVIEHAILPWETAAEAVESTRAELLKKSKKFGPRAPEAPPATATPAKDATTSEDKPTAPKRSGTPTLSTVPVAETPTAASGLSMDRSERERQVMAELGL